MVLSQGDKIRVIIIGACGRMGSAIGEQIREEGDMEVIYGVEKTGHPSLGLPFGKNFITDRLEDVIKEGDVVVDFSEVNGVLTNKETVIKEKRPYLCGVTGFKEDEFNELKKIGEYLPFLYSPNFSYGVNLLCQVLAHFSHKFPRDYDVKIIESHHKKKKDAPSGTAKRIAQIIEEKRGERVEVLSLRAGEIVGEHKVLFAGPGEVLEISHTALSRFTFVRGVIEGIRFIIKKPKGFYTFADVIGERG